MCCIKGNALRMLHLRLASQLSLDLLIIRACELQLPSFTLPCQKDLFNAKLGSMLEHFFMLCCWFMWTALAWVTRRCGAHLPELAQEKVSNVFKLSGVSYYLPFPQKCYHNDLMHFYGYEIFAWLPSWREHESNLFQLITGRLNLN